jgi:transposase-like protein
MPKTQHPCEPCQHAETSSGEVGGAKYVTHRCNRGFMRAYGPCGRATIEHVRNAYKMGINEFVDGSGAQDV